MQTTGLSGSYSYSETLRAVHYGPGCVVTALPALLKQLGGTKALIVTGNSLRSKTTVVSKIEQSLKAVDAFGETFSGVREHSPIADINLGVQRFVESGCDIIVAVGDGSPIDASKAIIYFAQKRIGGDFRKQIAIPTTLSAAEYTTGAGYTNEAGQKVLANAQELGPSGVILDAELTLDTPQRLWLSSGMRALDHAVENLYRPNIPFPLTRLCYAAIKDLFKFLPLSNQHEKDLYARQRLLLAAWMSLWPIKVDRVSALGLSHSLGHRLGATYGIGHGITSCLTLAAVVRLKASTGTIETKGSLSEALDVIGISGSGNLDEDVKRFSDEIAKLVNNLGLKTNLKACGVPFEDLGTIASAVRAFQEDAQYEDEVLKALQEMYSSA